MTYTQFWNDNPNLVESYREADLLRKQRASNEYWLEGLYFYHGLSTVIGNVLAKKGTPSRDYMSEPIRVIPLTKEEKEEKAENERNKVIAYLNNLAKKFEE